MLTPVIPLAPRRCIMNAPLLLWSLTSSSVPLFDLYSSTSTPYPVTTPSF